MLWSSLLWPSASYGTEPCMPADCAATFASAPRRCCAGRRVGPAAVYAGANSSGTHVCVDLVETDARLLMSDV
eukprot:scaffold9777_cov66-Phaeocystis_antarctica.AAC.4